MSECTPTSKRSTYAELMKISAELARGDGIASDCDEDHPTRMTRQHWLTHLERAHEASKDRAVRLRRLIDQLCADEPVAPTCCDGYVENGKVWHGQHCPNGRASPPPAGRIRRASMIFNADRGLNNMGSEVKTSTIEWNLVSPRPDKPGRYLIWSRDAGVRHTTLHPDWWNGHDQYKLGKIELYALLGEHFDQREMLQLYKKLTAKKPAKRRGAK